MIKVEKLNPFGRMCISLGMLPSSYKESMTYEEQLLWFFKFLDETVIPTVNNNAEAVEELQALYIQVKTFVDEYFDNLDVQEEINNKLDDMAESGELTDIIAQYLGLAGMFVFDNVADMKLAENLANGSKCTTLGYSSVNDGGMATYKVRTVTNNDVIDNAFIISLYDDTLVAELVYENPINILQLGCNETDNNTTLLQSALDKGLDLYIPEKTFLTDSLTFKFNKQKITGEGLKSVIKADSITTALLNIGTTIIDCEISNLYLNGDNKTGDAIYVAHTSLSEDSKESIKDVFIGYFNGVGINLTTANIHSAIISNCKVRNCTNGIRINGTDNFIDNTICFFNTLNGIYIDASGSNTKISNSKTYGNTYSGIHCIGSCCSISNVESQDNYKYGLYIKGWNENVDILCGNNCQQETSHGQIYCDGLYDSIITGVVNVTATTLTLQGVGKYALECNGTNTNNDITLNTHKFGAINIIPFKYTPNVTNRVIVNGTKYYPENVVANLKLGKVGTVSNLSEIFDTANIRANSDGSIVCSSTDQTQYMTIGNNVTGDYTSGITLSKLIDIDESVTKVDAYIMISAPLAYDSTDASFQLDLVWINSGGGAISNTALTGKTGIFVSSSKPENAVKLKYMVNFFPGKTNLNMTAGITDFQLGYYYE